jgi:hypothetical protein
LSLLLSGQDPAAAVAFDTAWNIVMVNEAYDRFVTRQFPEATTGIAPFVPILNRRLNLIHLIFAPQGYRAIVVNWEIMARAVLARATSVSSSPIQERCREQIRAGQALRGSSEFHAWGDSNPSTGCRGSGCIVPTPDDLIGLRPRSPAELTGIYNTMGSAPLVTCQL